MANEFTTYITLYAQKSKNLFFNSFSKNMKMREKTSSLCSKKKTYVNLEKSSTKTKIKWLSLRLLVLVGPNKSMWINSKGLIVMTSLIVLKKDLVCFSSWHASQMRSFLNCKLGMPFTDSLELIQDRWSNKIWHNLLSINQLCNKGFKIVYDDSLAMF